MEPLKRLLVAIDIDEGEVTASSLTAVEHACRVAEATSSEVVLAHVLEVPPELEAQMTSSNSDEPAAKHYQRSSSLLTDLANNARATGLEVKMVLLFGSAWRELIKEVLRGDYGLLVAGPTHRGGIMESLFGSTTMKLLRKCPCPVWVTKQNDPSQLDTIVVAHDFSEVGAEALKWGCQLAQAFHSELRVFHCLEAASSLLSTVPESIMKNERLAAKQKIEDELTALDSSLSANVIVVDGSPAPQIHRHITSFPTDLLVMGTIARCGLSGLISGNTAETLLPWVRCSLLALKPSEFVSPVTPID